jgi:hypothetical protein
VTVRREVVIMWRFGALLVAAALHVCVEITAAGGHEADLTLSRMQHLRSPSGFNRHLKGMRVPA